MSLPLALSRIGFRAILLGVLGGLLPTLVVTAPLTVRGRTFGRVVERALPELGGRVRIGGGRWTWGTVFALVRERPADIEIDEVRVFDPEGKVVLHVERLVGSVEIHRSSRSVVVRDLRVHGMYWRLDTARGGNGIGLVNALTPRTQAGDGAFSVAIPNAVLLHPRLTFDLASWGLDVDDVRALTASFSIAGGPGRRSALSFDVRGGTARAGGVLRVGGIEDPWVLPFTHARIDRVATTNAAGDALRVEVGELENGESALDLAATFRGVFADDVSPSLSLRVEASHAGDAVQAVLARRGLGRELAIGGAQAELSVSVEGPYANPTVDARASGLELRYRKTRLSDVAFRLAGEPLATRLRLDHLSAQWPGFGKIEGGLSIDTTAGAPVLKHFFLTVTRPAGGGGPRAIGLRSRAARARPGGATTFDVSELRLVNGVLIVPALQIPIGGGRLTAQGRLTFRDPKTARWLVSPIADVTLAARGLQLDRVLGPGFVRGALSCRAHVRGPLWDLAFDLAFPRNQTLTVFGERLRLAPRMTFILTQGLVYLHLKLVGQKSTALSVSGRVDLAGRLGLEVDVKDFPLARLPAVAESGLGLEGEISGRVQVSGTLEAPAAAGRLWILPVGLRGQELGQGALMITTEPAEWVHARGRLMDGVDVDGLIRTGVDGPRGEVTIRLDRLRLDPILPVVSDDLVARGVASGTLVARVGPAGAALDGSLSDLTLTVARWTTTRPRRLRPPVELVARGPIAVAAGPDGALSLGPARFTGAPGRFALTVRSRGADTSATLKGRLDLAALAALMPVGLAHPAGAVEVDLSASGLGGRGGPTIDGDFTVAKPVAFELTGLPATVRVSTGCARLANGELHTAALPVTFAAAFPLKGPISHVAGSVRLDARITTDRSPSSFRVDVETLRLGAPLVSPYPIVVHRGVALIEGPLQALDEGAVRELDLPLHGEAWHMTTAAGRIDRAAFELRLRGVPRRTLTLSGTVDVLGARLSPDRLRAATTIASDGARAASQPSLRNPKLDLQLRGRDGAVVVEIAHIPDVHVDFDLHAGGTLAQPAVSGEARPAGLYSALVMALERLLR